MTIFISSDNISQYAKVKGSRALGNREKVVLLWDELDRKQKNLAKNINIELEVQTENPKSVPDKWKDSIVELSGSKDIIEIIKMSIANPSRYEVWEMLKEEEPSEPLLLWWLDKVYSDEEYMKRLADACHYGLFRGDTDYLYAVVAFGVESGVGRFNWPESSKDDPKEKAIKKKVLDEFDIRPKELDYAWESVKTMVPGWVDLTEDQCEVLGVTPDDGLDSEVDRSNRGSSLLDFG